MRDTQGNFEFQVPSITDNALRLIAIFSLAFLVQGLMKAFTGVSPRELMLVLYMQAGSPDFHPLKVFTHFFIQGGGFWGLINLFFDAILLWFFGSELERNWGSHNFLKLFYFGLLGGLIAGVLMSFVWPMVMFGFEAGLIAILVAYAMIWPDRKVYIYFIIPIKMKWLILLIFIFLAAGNWRNDLITNTGGALAAALFVYYYARKGRQAQAYYAGGAVVAGAAGAGGKAGGGGPIDRVREHFRKKRLEKKQEEINRRIHMKEEVDRLLEKISKSGIKSLTRKEKKFLDQASREF